MEAESVAEGWWWRFECDFSEGVFVGVVRNEFGVAIDGAKAMRLPLMPKGEGERESVLEVI